MILTNKNAWAALAVACLLAACGGSDHSPADQVTSVKVMGDSLADSGTFGYKFTVQGSAGTGAGSTPIWPERIAASYNQTLCAHYSGADGATEGGAFARNAGCTNYAVGGGRINYLSAPTSPVSITQQIKDAGAAGYSASELVLLDGGANDAADLIGAYLQASSDGGAAYQGLLGTLLDAATLNAARAAGPAGLAQAGGAYMKALAAQFAATIQTHTLAKGATRVAVLNVPDITATPRFKLVLGAVAAAQGSAASEQAQALFDGWIQAFNQQLAASLAGDRRVVVVDFNELSKDQAKNPGQYQLGNVTTPVCPATGLGSDGLPTYTFPTCTAAALSATAPPAGVIGGADWWMNFAFSDSFHPTPYVHQLLAHRVSRSLKQAGWL